METKSIALLNNATRMLAEVQTIDDAKNLMDMASAAEHYARKHGLGKEAIAFAHSIEISAELKLGEILIEMEKNKGGNPDLQPLPSEKGLGTPTLEDMGISYKLSAESQALAGLSEADKAKLKSGQMTKKKGKGKAKQKKKSDAITEKVKEKAALPPEKVAALLPELVMADPPWKYDFAETTNREIENQYPTATVEELIKQRPVTSKNCILFMWATAPKLREAIELVKAWGYEYKTHAVWNKVKIGMGYWFRGQHELLLVATKGKVDTPLESMRVSSIFTEDRKLHSQKPECVYLWVEQTFPHLNKMEMYARRTRDGWVTTGNELP